MYPVMRSSRRLVLRELSLNDVDPVYAIYSSPEATRHLSFEPRGKAEVEDMAVRVIASAQATPRSEYSLAVVETSTGETMGVARLAIDPHQQRAATIGFALRPASWGVGYGLETVRLLCGLAFEELNLHRVWGARSPENTASDRTMTAAGMVREGIIREHIQKNGAWRDSVVHAILDREWSPSQQ
ncbi:GNAT family N-acetyltransferase [Streptomyces sp. NPDC091292]|uniref:GNAT family N-acetyltransferase n=1 Tax=Streptomyces sp. NPDC091292 TaxID=3365991 RepID=UPI0038031497